MGHNHIEALQTEGDLNLTTERQRWAASELDDKTTAILQEDARYFVHQSLSTPCLDVLASCEGATMTTQKGQRILDFHGNSVHQLGHNHPKIKEAIIQQMDALSFCPRRFTNKVAIDLAKALVQKAPEPLNRLLFAPAGSLAMGMALKIARHATGKFKTISMWDSFHGASLDMVSLGGEAIFRQGAGPLLPGCEHAPPPDPTQCVFGCKRQCNLRCADYIEYMIKKEGDVAAVVAETIRSIPFVPPKGYWQKIRQVCDAHGVLLILDEIPSCLGRTGRWFAFEHYEVVPDMVCIGKGLGGGIMPLAAVLVNDALNDAVKDKAIGHYTHEKSPVACAAALAMLQEMEDAKLLEHVSTLGDYALQKLKTMESESSLISDTRGLGFQLGIQVNGSSLGLSDSIFAEKILYRCLSHGLSFKITQGNILSLFPPLIVTKKQLDDALQILQEAIHFPYKQG